MRIVEARLFDGKRAWDALDIAAIDGATVRLHWSDEPYIWHVNEGPEVFAVLDGTVNMHVRDADGERTHGLTPGSIFYAGEGDAHRAVPEGPARVLVIERAGSV